MTSMEKKSPDADAPVSAAEQTGADSGRSADFGIDTTAKSTGEAIRAFRAVGRSNADIAAELIASAENLDDDEPMAFMRP